MNEWTAAPSIKNTIGQIYLQATLVDWLLEQSKLKKFFSHQLQFLYKSIDQSEIKLVCQR